MDWTKRKCKCVIVGQEGRWTSEAASVCGLSLCCSMVQDNYIFVE